MTGAALAVTTAVLEQPDGGHGDLVYRCTGTHVETCAGENEYVTRYNTPSNNLGVTGSLQWCYKNTTAPIIAFLHSDLEIFEQGWDERVLREFEDEKVGVVGFGGALQHGEDSIYKVPYCLTQLRRIGYLSNTTDAESHGVRFESACDVAVLDGFCLVLRRSLLDRLGGWPVAQLPFHSYDYWACIMAHKLGYKVRLIGVQCQHHGGGTTVANPEYGKWSERVLGKTDAEVHEESHRVIYELGRGVLPWRCE